MRTALRWGCLPPLPLLEVADELGQLRAQVEGAGQPGRALGASGPACDGSQAVLHRQQVLAGELVQQHVGPLLAEPPAGPSGRPAQRPARRAARGSGPARLRGASPVVLEVREVVEDVGVLLALGEGEARVGEVVEHLLHVRVDPAGQGGLRSDRLRGPAHLLSGRATQTLVPRLQGEPTLVVRTTWDTLECSANAAPPSRVKPQDRSTPPISRAHARSLTLEKRAGAPGAAGDTWPGVPWTRPLHTGARWGLPHWPVLAVAEVEAATL